MKKFKTVIKILAALVLLVILAAAAFRLRFVLAGKKLIRTTEELVQERLSENGKGAAEALVVLGCGVYQDGSLSPLLKYRMEKTLELYEAGLAKYIIVTGDHREGEYDEVDHMREWLLDRGVDETYILCDYEGYSTFESMEHVPEQSYYYWEDGNRRYRPVSDVIIVTQEYHLYRALYIAGKMGLECEGAAAKDWQLSLGTVYRHLREIPACLKDWLQFRGLKIRV